MRSAVGHDPHQVSRLPYPLCPAWTSPTPSGLRPSPPGSALDRGSRPPCGGKALGPFKYGRIRRFVGRLDTYTGNWGRVRLLEGGRPGVPPHKRGCGSLPSSRPPSKEAFPQGKALRSWRCTGLPAADCGWRNLGACAPHKRGAGEPALIAPSEGTFPPGKAKSLATRCPSIRRYLRTALHIERGQVWDLSLKTQRKRASHKIFASFLFKEGGPHPRAGSGS